MTTLSILVPAIGVILAVEAVVILAQDRGRRSRCLPMVLSGLAIVLAWNATAYGAAIPVTLAALSAALVSHAIDLYRRW